MTSGNLFISLIDKNENFSWYFVTLFLEIKRETIMALAKINAVIWNRILYVMSSPSRNTVPNNGPIINPITKNIVNHEMFLTLVFSLLSLAIMDWHGGQKNAWAIPVITLNPIISGTVCAIDRR